MFVQQRKIFKFLVFVFLGLSLAVCLFSANEEILHFYDGASTYEKDGLKVSNFKIIGPSPWKAGDTITVEFDLQNVSKKPIYFGKRGIFVGCLNPNGEKEDFGHQYKKFSLAKGKSVHVKAVKKLGKKGNWTFWPSYFLGSTRWIDHRRGLGPHKWKAALIKPTTKPITKLIKAIPPRIKHIRQELSKPILQEQNYIVRAKQDLLLKQYDTSDKKFKKKVIGQFLVYHHTRKIGEAIVEGDFIRYKFSPKTKKLVDKKMQWRPGLPERIPPVIDKRKAEALVRGKVKFSKLYIISPESRVLRIKTATNDPCWIVSSFINGRPVISIINAVTGKFLGYGDPPPATSGFSLVGPNDWHGCADLPQYWLDMRNNAASWFISMGYPTTTAQFPPDSQIRDYIYNWETPVFYEIAHSGTGYGEPRNKTFLSGCDPEKVTAYEVRNWITHCPKVRFAFLTSCFSMCDTESTDTLSYSFRKGSNYDTTTVGGCGLSETQCFSCWLNYYNWQDDFFSHVNNGDTVRQAFDNAMVNYSQCDGCIRFAGDETLRLVPGIIRNFDPIVAYWPFREGAGNNVWDYTPAHNHGIRNGAAWTQGISGPGGNIRHWESALRFDGNNDYVEVAYNSSFNLTDFTLEAWVKFTDSTQIARIISRPSGGNPTHGYSFFSMTAARGRIGGGVQGEGRNYSSSTSSRTNVADGVWHKCTFVRNVRSNFIKIYVDGQLQGEYPNASPGNMNHNRNGIYIGSTDRNKGFFNGTICNVNIWGKALSDEEIKENFIWEADEDGDGISLQVDPAPGAFSNIFRNGPTSGIILNRGDQILILLPRTGGVLVKADAAGGAAPATVRNNNGNVTHTLNAGDEIHIH